jgi:orotate phosphoribosyltransferase
MYQLNKGNSFGLKRASQTFPSELLLQILGTKEAYTAGHFEFPAQQETKRGNHLDAIYLAEPIMKRNEFVDAIVADMILWIEREKIEFDVVLSLSQDSARKIVTNLCSKLSKKAAYLAYFPSGWLGGKIVEGQVLKGDRVLIFAPVDQTGRTIGETIPKFIEQNGGTVAGIAAFCKGTAGGVITAEHKFGKKFYSSIQAHIAVHSAAECPACKIENAEKLRPWTELAQT